MKRLTIFGTAALLTLWAGTLAAQQYGSAASTTTITAATGTITQLNYDNNGSVQGFLIGTNVLLGFFPNVCGGLSGVGAVGDNVTYSGTAFTATSGFQSIMVTSFTNSTTGASFTSPDNTSNAYPATSGTVKQLNYSGNGSVDGFVFSASGSTSPIFVSTGFQASATLTTLLTAGATVSVTGTIAGSGTACSLTGALEAVNASSLTIGGQTIVLHVGGGPGGPNGNRGPH